MTEIQEWAKLVFEANKTTDSLLLQRAALQEKLDAQAKQIFALTGEVANKADYAARMCRMHDAAQSQLEVQAKQIEALQADAERLDYVLENLAFLHITVADGGNICYQLMTQDEDENYIKLSGIGRFFSTPRAAIDAARKGNV
jgi:hypothetical protein